MSRTPVLVTVFLAAAIGLTAAEPSSAPVETGIKDYVIYFGLDIAVNDRGSTYPVISARDEEIRVLKDGSDVRMPAKNSLLTMTREPMVSRWAASIEDLDGDRAYSPGTDPAMRAFRQQLMMQLLQDQAQETATMEASKANRAAAQVDQASRIPLSRVTKADVNQAYAAANVASQRMTEASVIPPYRTVEPGQVDDQGTYDAFAVKFRIATPQPCENAYGLLRLFFRAPDEPNKVVQTSRFFALRDLGPEPQKIAISVMGLPPGFAAESYEVHVYVAGREIATNLSPNRVEVTENEAHQFLVLRYMQQNRQANTPAQVIRELLPAEISGLVSQGDASAVVDLAIDRDGKVAEIVSSRDESATLNTSLAKAVQQVRFYPALVTGNPVASRGTFALGEFAH